MINRGYRVEIKPNNKQKTLLNKAFGVARFAYNWGLARRIELYKNEKKSLSAIDQHKELCILKKEQFPWMYEVSKCVPQEALIDLEDAYNKFYKSNKNFRYPKFKTKHKSKDSFRVSSGNFYITESSIKIPKIGQIKLKEKRYIPTAGIKYNSITVSKDANKYFVSVQCEVETPGVTEKKETVLGIDLGIKTLLVCSNGEIFDNPKTTYKYEKKLAHAQKNFSRTKKGSKNRTKANLKVQKIYRKIKNSRMNNLHRATSAVVKTKPRYIVLEDLNVKGMTKNHHLAKAVSDGSFGEIYRQFKYKALWYGSEIIDADRFYPSSKLCRKCGQIKDDLTLEDRVYTCECGHTEDRDLNASINLEEYGLNTLSSRGIKACGESVRLLDAIDLEAVSTNQEENNTTNLVSCI
jgi:putative transposase